MTDAPTQTSSAPDLGTFLTYVSFAVSGGCVLAMAAPWLLGALGIVDPGWTELTIMWVAIPSVLSVLVAGILSLIGLVRGPWTLRMRTLGWWVVAGGGCAHSMATAPSVDFNPYLGIPAARFGVSHAALMIGVGLGTLMPCRWVVREWRSAKPFAAKHPRSANSP